MSPQVQCLELHPEHGLRCQLNTHPPTIRHYAVKYEPPMEFFTWEPIEDFDLITWPESPQNVRLVTADGEELLVDLIYTGVVDGVDRWTTAPPCTRDLVGMRIDACPPAKCVITIDRGGKT